jgi:hypothetical protein
MINSIGPAYAGLESLTIQKKTPAITDRGQRKGNRGYDARGTPLDSVCRYRVRLYVGELLE